MYYHMISAVIGEHKVDSSGQPLYVPETNAMGMPTGNEVPDVSYHSYGVVIENASYDANIISIDEVKAKVAECKGVDQSLILECWKMHNYVSQYPDDAARSNYCK